MHVTPQDAEKSAHASHKHHAFAQLEQLARQLQYGGINIWSDIDDGEVTYHVEYKDKHVTGRDLEYAILRAVGKMPMRTCQQCKRDRDINCFVRRANSPDGFGNLCNICNRLKSRASLALHDVSERAC